MKMLSSAIVFVVGIAAGFLLFKYLPPSAPQLLSPVLPSPTPKPLQKYAFSELQKYSPQPSPIHLKETMFTEAGLTAYKAVYFTNQHQMSLQLMVPSTATPSAGFPVILMVRGFVDTAVYQTGVGTKNAARYFANHGYVTVAPDFLGYGDSDPAPEDTIASRLERPQQLLDLLASLPSLPFINPRQVGIWGHSNGGQITLSLLEVSQQPYPTVLWAPVTKPFPYSILYYTDDSDDGGKALRKVLADFEKEYDVFDFTLDRFVSSITAPLEIHQGDVDTAVPVSWSTAFVKTLHQAGKDVTYFTYPGADHNLQPGWNTAIERSLDFFNKNLYGKK